MTMVPRSSWARYVTPLGVATRRESSQKSPILGGSVLNNGDDGSYGSFHSGVGGGVVMVLVSLWAPANTLEADPMMPIMPESRIAPIIPGLFTGSGPGCAPDEPVS
jgi:hypothetical protein